MFISHPSLQNLFAMVQRGKPSSPQTQLCSPFHDLVERFHTAGSLMSVLLSHNVQR